MANWLSGLKSLIQGKNARRPARKQPATKPRSVGPAVERLEDRLTPSAAVLDFNSATHMLLFTGGSNADNLTVSVSAGKYTFKDTGSGVTITVTSAAAAFGFTGSGTNTVTGGTLPALDSISITGSSVNDTINIQSIGNATTVTGSSGTNTINVSSNAPTNTGNLNGIAAALTVTASNNGMDTLNVSNFGATSGDSNVLIGNFLITGFAGSSNNQTISYNTTSGGTFTLLHVFGSNSPTLAEKFTVNNPGAKFQLDSQAGPDTVNVQGTIGAATVNMTGGNHTINVGSNGSSANITGALSINAGTGTSVLNVDDSQNTANHTNIQISGSTIQNLAGATITYTAIGGKYSAVNVHGSQGTNSFTVTASSPVLNLYGDAAGGKTDSYILKSNATIASVTGNSAADTLTYDSSYTNAISVGLTSSTANGFGASSAPGITSGFSGIDTLNDNAGGGTLSGENVAGTWTLGSPSTYYDGSHTLDFSGFGTLNGSGSDTLAHVTDATLTGSPNGFSGTADSPSVAFTGMTTLDGTGSGTLSNGEGTAGTWTLGSPSTYFDGSNTLTFSGFTTLDGSGSDTLANVADATLTGSSASGFSGNADSPSVAFTGMTTLDGTGSGTLSNGEGTAGTWTVYALSETSDFYDGSYTLLFSGFSTLNAGNAGDEFDLQSDAASYSINGGAGTDTLTGVSDPTLTGSGNSNGYGGTADNSISFTAIDAIAGSGTFTGDDNASTFTINSTSTYNDGQTSNSLSLSGFGTIAGGTGDDYFTIVVPGSDTEATLGTLDGGGGSNTLDATNVNSADQIADGYNYRNFQVVLSGGTFYGPNTNSTYEWNGTDWLLNGTSIGTPTTIQAGTANDTFIVDANTTTSTNLLGGGGDDTFTIDSGAQALGAIDGGTGSNTLNVPGSVTLTGSENDGSEVGYAGTNANLGGSGFVGISILNDTNATPDALTGESGAYGTWTVGDSPPTSSSYADNTGTGVALTLSGFATLNAGAGDTFNLTSGVSTGFTINGGSGSDTLTGVSNAALSSSSDSGFSGTADNSISFTAIDVLDGAGSLTGENTASTWTVYASSETSSYSDGSATLDFSGFTTLSAGNAGDEFDLQSDAASYTINGGSGTDTLTGVANATLSSSTSNGFSGTADSGISFTAIDVLDGSGSLTNGEGTASTWTLGSPSTYSDGVSTLDFNGFTTLNGSGNDTLAGVYEATLTGSSTGFSGTADYASIAFSGMTTLSGDGSATLTGESTTSTWTLGSPSTYFDGSNTLSFSGFTTLNGSGSDTLANVTDATITGSSTGFSGNADSSSYTFNGMSVLNGTGSASLTNGEGYGITWTLGSPSTYSDGSNTLSFTGFTTLNGSGADTLANVSDATLTGSPDNFSGTADSPNVSFTGMSALSGNGSASLTNGEGTASTWTVYASSETSYYSDGNATLYFGGFSTLNADNQGDTFNLQADAAGYTINGGTGYDTLSGVANAILSSSTSSGFSGTADSGISFSAIDELDGTGALTGENTASTWTLGSPSTYSDGSYTLNFSGFTTLNGSGNDTLAGVYEATLTSSSTGFSGTADDASIAFSGMTTLSGDGSATLTGESTTSTWTLGSPSTYFDGSNTLDFSGFTTLNGSGSDTLANVTDATLTGSYIGYYGTADSGSYSFSGMSTLNGTGSSTLTNGESYGITWTLGSPSTYFDGSNTLDFSGFTTLNGSGADTLANVADATLTSSPSGFSGTADSPSVSFTGMSTLDGNGSASLTNGEGTASTWTVYASSETSYYSDGNESLYFSGFSTLNAGNQGDTFNLQADAAGYSINGGSGYDTLSGVANAVLSSSTSSGFSGTADSGISFSAIDELDGTGALTGENTASTWTLGSPSTYSDGSYTLNFSGFTTLNGSGNDTLAGVYEATLTSSSTGFSGTADDASIAFSGMSTLSGDGSAPLTNAEGTSSTWTLGSPSTYSDGSNTLSFSGFTTLNGSGSDTLANVTDATITGSSTGFSGTADSSSYTFNGMSTLNGTGSASLTNGEGYGITWTLGSPSTYYDGSNTLSFTGFTTLNGSGADTLANVADATLTNSPSGFSGTADSPSVSFTGMSTLDGNGSASLTNGEGTASTWTVYASSETSSYYDGNESLDFSGFSTLNADNQGDTFNLQADAAGYNINGGSGYDILSGVADAVLTSSSDIGFSGTADSGISFTAIDELDGTGALTGENTASTWTLGSPSTYFDGTSTLNFSGFTTLNGSGNDTLAGVYEATLTSSSTGFSGTADYSSIAFSGMSTLNGDGSATLTNGEGTSSTWTLGSPSTYYDGSNTLSFSGFTTLNGSGSDTLANVTDATLTGSSTGFSGTVNSSSYTFNGMSTLNGTGSATLTNAEGTASTWTLGSPSTYYDGSNTLSFTGFTTLNGSGSDTLANVADATLTSSSVGYSGTADSSSYSFTGMSTLVGNDSGILTNGEGTAVTWTVYAFFDNSSYSDGNWTLTFSGFTTLNAGNAGDEFDLQSGAAGYSLNGGTGTDTLTGVSDPTLASSSSSGFTGTSDNGNEFSAIDVLDGTGQLTNAEGTASTWTLGSPSTYFDGSYTLTFSGFSTLYGSGNDTLANVSDATLTGSSNGFSGTADSPSVAFAGMSTLDGNGSATLTNGEGTAATWTLGSPSTYNDGSNTLTFSGFTTLNGSGSDTLANVSDATLTGSDNGFSGTADSASYSFTGMNTLEGTGDATLTNGEGYGITWTLGSPSTYYDGYNTLSFTGFTTLNGSGADTLANVADATLTASPSGFSGTADSPNVSFTGMSTLSGNGSASLTNGEGTASTWTVYASSETSSYYDGNASLDFSGFSTLNADNQGDTFNLQSDAAGYTINGGTGTDTLTGVANAFLALSNSSGFSGTADNSISFTAIDVLDGTGALTGENAASTWTVYASSANSTYNDGSNSLTFSDFTTLNAGTGGDTFNLQSSASGYTINGGSGTDTLTGVADAVLTSSGSTGFSGTADNSITFSAIDVLDGSGSLSGENLASTWTVYDSSSNSSYNDGSYSLTFSGFSTLNAGNAGDEFDLQTGASGYTINGGSGTDTLTGVSNPVLSSSDSTGFSGTADNSITFSAIDVLDGSGSLTGENTAGTWTVDASSANSTYNDGSYSLTFSGFSTLNAGSGGDTFNLQSDASGYTINGGSGTDTLTGVADAILNSSNGNGFSGSADNSISFTAIDVLAGSGSLTNNEGVSAVWDVSANPTYNDGSNTLSFSGFDTLNGGTAGDEFFVSYASQALTLNGNGGANDLFAIGVTASQSLDSDGSLANITANVTVNGSADAILNVSDSSDTTAVVWTITASDIQSGGQGDILYNGPDNINLYFGGPTDGNRNAVDVESLQSGANVLLQDQGNTDYQFAQVGQDLNALSGTSIVIASSNSGSDIVALNDQSNTNTTTYNISDTGVTFGVGSIYFLGGGPSEVIVYGGTAANTFNVIPSTATTFYLVDGSGGSSSLNYLASQVSSPPINPFNDGIFSISDRNDYYQLVYYFDFNTSLVNID